MPEYDRPAPILIVLEDNHIAQTTPSHLAIAGDMQKRFEAFGIPTTCLDTSDILEILPTASRLIEKVRFVRKPQAVWEPILRAMIPAHQRC